MQIVESAAAVYALFWKSVMGKVGARRASRACMARYSQAMRASQRMRPMARGAMKAAVPHVASRDSPAFWKD
jgi:hypothetical protein